MLGFRVKAVETHTVSTQNIKEFSLQHDNKRVPRFGFSVETLLVSTCELPTKCTPAKEQANHQT